MNRQRSNSPEAPAHRRVFGASFVAAFALLGAYDATKSNSHGSLAPKVEKLAVPQNTTLGLAGDIPVQKPLAAKPVISSPKRIATPKIKVKAAAPELAAIKNGCDGAGATPETVLLGLSAAQNPNIGNVALLCAAKKYDNDLYLYGGGHGDPADWKNAFNASGGYQRQYRALFDCSGIIHQAIWDAYGVKTYSVSGVPAAFNDIDVGQTRDASGKPLFRRISLSDVKTGDVIGYPGHVEIASSDKAASFFGAQTSGIAPDMQIQETTVWDRAWTYNFRYIGPGSAPDNNDNTKETP